MKVNTKINTVAPHVVPDEPLICPVTPGAALSRLCEVIGALEEKEAAESLLTARDNLLAALENGEQNGIGQALRAAQESLTACYDALEDADLCADAAFPPPGKVSHRARHLQPVDLSSLQVTCARFGKQVMVSFAFRDAPGATAYWLREVRYIDDAREEWARMEDQLIQSFTPLFSRVRLPPGTRHFRIEARNPAGGLVTDEFTIEIPEI